ncbi:uncharacterized protein [Zea mays]|uniref:Mitochondrial glycoprotein n=1 Tax=Zea mays TaxID=4577 RepID=C0PD11_MAIZE|nr:uncharacterized protein LOC100283937 [Zea mays]XP_008668059.1 uncharacterized protein LOC100283937 isoform X1 [Zea mays]XP_035820710.1 uncharacterized protein LOC100283937 isoform X1 [Zea mays]ACN32056.1 unknown [Zea mays]ONM23525.1 hypothetical protein ZEAMMB73_Zm00001d006324 [Zea mays]ONM23526.1 hypothetical protein ZEAMMB73_Zm00001d006324 [Zea mays]|eukprot:XP_008668059.1 mitochondrial glycoprotein isoform X1 [Zea mays]
MACTFLRRAFSLTAAGTHATPRVAAAFASTSSSSSVVVPLRSPLDHRLLRHLRSEITYLAERRPPHVPPSSFKSFAVEDRPGEQWVRLRASAGGGGEEVKVEATMFDGAAEPVPDDAPLFRRVESLERGPRLHLSLIVEVARGDRVLGFVCSAWPDDLAVRHVLTLAAGGGSSGGRRGGRDFEKLGGEEREAVTKFLKEREVDAELAGFLHDYMANKEKMELLRWLKTVESFLNK